MFFIKKQNLSQVSFATILSNGEEGTTWKNLPQILEQVLESLIYR